MTVQTIQEWLQSSNTGDVLHDAAVVEAALGQAIGEALGLRKKDIQEITDNIKRINQLSDFLRSKRPGGTDVNAPNSPPFTEADKKWIVDTMKEFTNMETNIVTDDGLLSQSQFNQFLEALSGASSDLSTESQQHQADVQSLLGRYNGSMDTASGLIKKREQLGDSTANNFRAPS